MNEVATTLQALAPALAANPTLALANAVLFLEAFGHTVIAWIWLRQAIAAQRGLQSGIATHGRRLLSWQTGRLPLVLRWELPKDPPVARTAAQPRRHHREMRPPESF
jgi:hypothetical protein